MGIRRIGRTLDGLIRNIYDKVELRIARGPYKPGDSPDGTSGSERSLKREWRVESAVRLLKKEYGVGGLRARVLLLLAVTAGVVAVVVCEAVGASHLLDALVRARRTPASAARVIAGGVAALAAAVSSARLAAVLAQRGAGAAILRRPSPSRTGRDSCPNARRSSTSCFVSFACCKKHKVSSSSSRSSTTWIGGRSQ